MSRLLQVTFVCSLAYRSLLNDHERKAICGGEFNKYFLKISVLSIGRYGIEIKDIYVSLKISETGIAPQRIDIFQSCKEERRKTLAHCREQMAA